MTSVTHPYALHYRYVLIFIRFKRHAARAAVGSHSWSNKPLVFDQLIHVNLISSYEVDRLLRVSTRAARSSLETHSASAFSPSHLAHRRRKTTLIR